MGKEFITCTSSLTTQLHLQTPTVVSHGQFSLHPRSCTQWPLFAVGPSNWTNLSDIYAGKVVVTNCSTVTCWVHSVPGMSLHH